MSSSEAGTAGGATNGARDHFEVLGVERRFEQDAAELERRYKQLARETHPDRFVKAEPRERRAALQRSVAVNEAWKTLRDPVRRAEYLLSLHGIEVAGEEGTVRAASGAKQRTPVPQALLMEVLELREALFEARLAGDAGRVTELAQGVRRRRARAFEEVTAGFGREPADLDRVTAGLVEIRYWERFLEEVEAHEEAAQERQDAEAGRAGMQASVQGSQGGSRAS